MEYFKVYRGTILINKMKTIPAIHIKIIFLLPLFDVKV